MTRIVHFGKYYFPDAGGIESVTLSLARGSVASGHVVTVVCFEKTPANSNEVLDGVRVIRAPMAKLIASQPLGLKYLSVCLQEAKCADVIHLHAPNMLGALCALLAGRKPRLLVHWHSDVINKGLLKKLLRPLETALLRRANSIVATSQVYADASETLTPFREKVAVVPIGVPDAKHRSDDTSDAALAPELEVKIAGRKIVLAVGRLVPYKGFDVLIEAAKDLRDDAVVVIVGGGPLHDELRAAIDAAGLSSRVHLTGRMKDEPLHALFSKAALYCLPSTYRAEAFGVVLLEAMAYGLPIVATEIPGSGVPWVNQHGTSGLNVPVGDAKALALACNQILDSDEQRARLSRGARARFMSEFTEEISVKRMMATYDRLDQQNTGFAS
ncbi:MAG: glycosyltransferase [Gammaproteobacteria bacterium]|nr:glycosyltransferase [Gammaproteobacteria bacterium]